MKVVFFPRNDNFTGNPGIDVCKHRHGKKITMCESTTMIPYWVSKIFLPHIVELNKTSNIRVCGYFDWRHNGDASAAYSSYLDASIMEQIHNDVIYPDLYYLSEPTSDYSEEAQERSKQKNWKWFKEKFGRYPNGMEYGLSPGPYGNYMCQYVLSADSNTSHDNTDYGVGVGIPNDKPYSRSLDENDTWSHRNFYGRPIEYAISDDSYEAKREEMSRFIDSVMNLPNGGFIRNFNHWHRVLYTDIDPNTGEILEGREDTPAIKGFMDYFDMLAEKNKNDEIYFSGHGEAAAYLAYRESISKTTMYEKNIDGNDSLVIRLEFKNVFNLNNDLLGLLNIPISIKFSTIGTKLEGKEIQSDLNIIKLKDDDYYIVEIPYNTYPLAIITEKTITN